MTNPDAPAVKVAEVWPWWRGIHHPDGPPLPLNVLKRGSWYAKEMRSARWRSQLLDLATLILAAAVPFAVAANASSWVPALLGSLAAVGAGIRQTFGWQKNWISFSQASMQIEGEIVRFGAGVSPYEDPRTAQALLATKVEDITAAETGTWAHRPDADPAAASR